MIHTFGYHGKPIAVLHAWLVAHDAMLFDIRYHAQSWSPDWKEQSLRRVLGDRYRHIPYLGNRNYNSPGMPIEIISISAGLAAIKREMQTRNTLVLMCQCPNFETCHRSEVADALYEDGLFSQELILPEG